MYSHIGIEKSPILKRNCSGEYWTMNNKFDPVILYK